MSLDLKTEAEVMDVVMAQGNRWAPFIDHDDLKYPGKKL